MKIVLLACYCFGYFHSTAQQIWANDITGSDPGLTNPYTTGQVVSNKISVSGIGHSTGVSGATGNDSYTSFLWTKNNTIDPVDYIYFTITPVPGEIINFSSLNYNASTATTGPSSFALRSSLDNFTTNIATPPPTGATIDLTGIKNISGPITFRLYGYNALDDLGTFAINDFEFNTTTALPVTFGELISSHKNEELKIQWQTLNEHNTDYFEIEGSGDGKIFRKMAKVNARSVNGNSNSPIRYEAAIPHAGYSWEILTILGIGFLGLMPASKRQTRLLIIFSALFFSNLLSCHKNSQSYKPHDNPLFIRIAQVEKNGTTNYSRIVLTIRK